MASAEGGPKTLDLLRGKIDLDTALNYDDNVLQLLSYPSQRLDFFVHLYIHRADIEAIVAHHLGFSRPSRCRTTEVKHWINGSFNVCVPVDIDPPFRQQSRVLIRFPLPYNVGERHFPGNCDEKLRCEVATYIWLQKNCPSIPILKLLGFGFASDKLVSASHPLS